MALGVGDIGNNLARVSIEQVNNANANVVDDFAHGKFKAFEYKFSEYRRLINDLGEDGKTVVDGLEVDINTIAGSLAIQIHLQIVEARSDAMKGLADAGLKNENKLWTQR